MSNPPATLHTWLAAPLPPAVARAIDRLRHLPGARRIAVMPDVHLATDVAIGVVLATTGRLYPQAVGGDIGCGMLAVGFDLEASVLKDPQVAGRVLAALGRAVPPRRRNRRAAIGPPSGLETALSHPALDAMRKNEAVIETTPGTKLRVHRQTLARVIEGDEVVTDAEELDAEAGEITPAEEPEFGERTEKPKRAPRKKPAE